MTTVVFKDGYCLYENFVRRDDMNRGCKAANIAEVNKTKQNKRNNEAKKKREKLKWRVVALFSLMLGGYPSSLAPEKRVMLLIASLYDSILFF